MLDTVKKKWDSREFWTEKWDYPSKSKAVGRYAFTST